MHHHGAKQRGKKSHLNEKFGLALISKVRLFGKGESNFFPQT